MLLLIDCWVIISHIMILVLYDIIIPTNLSQFKISLRFLVLGQILILICDRRQSLPRSYLYRSRISYTSNDSARSLQRKALFQLRTVDSFIKLFSVERRRRWALRYTFLIHMNQQQSQYRSRINKTIDRQFKRKLWCTAKVKGRRMLTWTIV